MAWIKFEHATLGKPEVHLMAEQLRMKPETVLGHLLHFWVWCDQQSVDGRLSVATESLIDRVSGAKGFARALVGAGWLDEEDGRMLIPNFERHNGLSAKRRADSQLRMAKMRSKKSAPCDGSVTQKCNTDVTKTSPEERREEKKEPSIVSPASIDTARGARIHADVERACRIFGRRAQLSYTAQGAMAELSPIPEEEFEAIEWFYGLAKDEKVQELKTRRQSVDTLVCNWLEEVDKARNYAKTLGISISEIARKKKSGGREHGPDGPNGRHGRGGYPAGARGWVEAQRQPEDTVFVLPDWGELPGDLRREWAGLPAEEQRAWAKKEEAL